jgi:ribosomal-protein-alanine N-acetyltransferase
MNGQTTPKPSVYIRCMLNSDIDQVAMIEQIAAPRHPWSSERIAHELMDSNANCWILESEDTRTLIGYCIVRVSLTAGGCGAHLVNIGIHPDMHGKGYGRHLLDHLISYARDTWGAGWMELEVHVANTRAINLYMTSGFHFTELLTNYYGDGNDAHRMELSLR